VFVQGEGRIVIAVFAQEKQFVLIFLFRVAANPQAQCVESRRAIKLLGAQALIKNF
jgi:hypothetical protein